MTKEELKNQVGVSDKYLVLFPLVKMFAKRSYGKDNGLLSGKTAHVKLAHKYKTFEEAFEVWGPKMIWDNENPGYNLPRIVTIETAVEVAIHNRR